MKNIKFDKQSTIKGCFDILDKVLSKKDKNTLIEIGDKDKYLSSTHFALGMWMRNNLINFKGTIIEEFLAILTDRNDIIQAKIATYDEYSSLLIKYYYLYLKGEFLLK